MVKFFQNSIFIFMILLCAVAGSGCIPLLVGAAAGAGGVAYVQGAAVQNIDESVAEIHKASLAALKDLKVFVVEDELNKHSALIKAEYADGKKIQIKISALTEFVSKIYVRVGILGNSEESQMILDMIQQEL